MLNPTRQDLCTNPQYSSHHHALCPATCILTDICQALVCAILWHLRNSEVSICRHALQIASKVCFRSSASNRSQRVLCCSCVARLHICNWAPDTGRQHTTKHSLSNVLRPFHPHTMSTAHLATCVRNQCFIPSTWLQPRRCVLVQQVQRDRFFAKFWSEVPRVAVVVYSQQSVGNSRQSHERRRPRKYTVFHCECTILYHSR